MSHCTTERVLVVQVTAACNLRCAYCFQRAKRPRALAWGPLRAALEWVLRSGPGRARIAFTGGEPLLALPTIRRAVTFVERERPRDLDVTVAIMTNGVRLDDETIAFCAAHDIRVELSFDGVPAAQDLRGRGTFAPLDRLVSRLRHERPTFFARRFRVAITLCRENVPWLAESVAYFLGAGVPEIALAPAMTPDTVWTAGDAAELDRQFARVHADSVEHYQRTAAVPLELFRKTAPDPPAAAMPDGPCGIGAGHALAVDAAGRALPCPLFAEGYHTPGSPLLDAAAAHVSRVGRVGEPGVTERLAACGATLQATPLFGSRRSRFSSWGRCGDCEYLPRCSVCPMSIGLIPRNTNENRVPEFQCAFTRTSLAWRDRFPCQSPLQDAFRRFDRLLESVYGP